jgi:hypothetical protein
MPSNSFTYDHRTLKTRLPVRSALFKQRTGGLVVRWVTTGESPLLYVFFSFCWLCGGSRRRLWGDNFQNLTVSHHSLVCFQIRENGCQTNMTSACPSILSLHVELGATACFPDRGQLACALCIAQSRQTFQDRKTVKSRCLRLHVVLTISDAIRILSYIVIVVLGLNLC